MGESGAEVSVTPDRASVGFRPPLVAAVLLISGRGLHFAFPTSIFDSWWPGLAIGLPFLGVALGVQLTSILTLKRAKTTPFFSATSLVVKHGPYARSRNPIYVGFFIWTIGLPFVVNTVWLLPLFFVLGAYFNFWVVPREEDYLERNFGEDYGSYRLSVPRWL